MVGDRVDELRPQTAGEPPLELVDLEPVVVHGDGDEVGLEAPERLDRAEVGRRLDDDHIAAVEEGLADQLERLDRAAREQELLLGRAAALQRFHAAGDRVERTGEPPRRRILERARLAGGGELLQERGDALAGKRRRIGEAARERDHVRHPEQREDRRDPLPHVAPRAGGEERLTPDVGRHRHTANPSRAPHPNRGILLP